ncbi:MAG: SDR family oxidoreductase [Novosphingobium sp.]|nr:SDR family oxidoreductase [Novosphingobium sp.]
MTDYKAMFDLTGKVAIVTGAGGRPGGIGQAYASALGAFGAKVVAVDVNGDGAAKAAEDLKGQGIDAIGVQCDVSDASSVTGMVAQAKAAFGKVDILVNNAALMLEAIGHPLCAIPLAEYEKIMAVNVTGPILCAQAVLPGMREAGWGRIVNQLSSGAFPAQSVYGVSKLALLGVTTTLAQEAGRSGITVNAIAPGVTDSGAGLTLRENPSEYSKMWEMMCPLSYRGQPDQLTGAMLYLCSEAGSWTTGQVIHVDGGAVMIP